MVEHEGAIRNAAVCLVLLGLALLGLIAVWISRYRALAGRAGHGPLRSRHADWLALLIFLLGVGALCIQRGSLRG